MFENLGQFELNLASLFSACAGVFGCWLVQGIVQRRRKTEFLPPRVEPAKKSETAATLQQRAAEDELVLRWMNESETQKSAGSKALRAASGLNGLDPTKIAAELLPFNPLAAGLTGNRTESSMMAAVERIESLLASVDPPATFVTPPANTLESSPESVPPIRDPDARYSQQPDDPQRRRSDQAIIYDSLLRRCLGDDGFAWRMLHKFPSRCRAELESLATELRRRAWTEATRRINQLRGIAANLAADNLRDALANLEDVCRQQSATRADQLLEAVHCEFQQVLNYLDRAGGEQFLDSCDSHENQPISRWPAELLADEDSNPLHLDTPLAGRVS